MGLFTPTLREVMRFEHDTGDGLRIGLDDYPIFDESKRIELNQLIIDNYLNRDIGLSSIPQFTHQLRLKMRLIMPYYNQLYKSEVVQFDPLSTFNLETTRADLTKETGSGNVNNGTTVSSNSGARNVNSDLPETMLSGDEDYATSATDANSNGSTTSTTKSDNATEGTVDASGSSTTKGYQGSAADLLQKYRATFLNIGASIVRDCGDLFFLVRGTGIPALPHFSTSQLQRELGHL